MRFKNRFVTGAVAVGLAASGAVLAVAGPASATAPTGGCWVYSPHTPADVEDTVLDSSTSTSLAAWADPTASPSGNADYSIATAGSTVVGGSRTFDLTFNKGPKNGGPAASGVAYYYFSVNGTNLPVISKAFSVGGAATIPGDTISGAYTITATGAQSVKLRKVYYDIPTFTVRVACNGQTSGSASVNPATTPVDSNIVSSSFTATGPTATITSISNQTVLTSARKADTVSFDVTNFTGGAGTGTVSLCDSNGASCNATTGSVTIAGDGTGSGTYTLPSNATTAMTGAIKIVKGSDTSLTPLTVLSAPTISTNVTGGGAGTVVTVTGTNWDPNQSVSVSSTVSGPPYPPAATADTPVVVTASATGTISATWTVNDPTTAFIGASRTHAAGPPPVVIFTSAAFTFSGDSCTAKVGAASTGSCPGVETTRLTVTAGDLKMSKVTGDVILSPVTLDGTAHTSTGSLKDVTVMDYRGGTLGWTLTAKFSGLTGPATITPDKMTWTPSCTPSVSNNDDTVTTGTAGAFSTAAVPFCKVAVADVGADGASGGDTLAQAGLSLALNANQKSGAYVGTVTLTLS